jgi:DDE domain
MDERYMKVKGEWYYFYHAVDKHGQTIDFLLTEHRDQEAALRFLQKRSAATVYPRPSRLMAVRPMRPPSSATTGSMAPTSASVR